MIARGIVLQPEMSIDIEPGAVTLIDQSRYKSHGTITGAVYVQEPSGLWVLDFDPTIPSYVEIPADQTQLDFTSEDFSLVVRVNVDSLAVQRGIFCRGFFNTDGYRMDIATTGQVSIETFQGAANQQSLSSAGTIITGVWYTVGFSRAGNSIRIYVDGIDVTITAGNHIDPLTCARSAKIGIYDNLTSNPFDGTMGFLCVYNYALTAGQHLIENEKVKHWFGVHD